jgi:hypothetical protein
MIDIIKYFNEEYLYETILTVSIVIIILYALYSYITGKKGTWSQNVYYSLYDSQPKQNNSYHQRSNDTKDSKGEIECRHILEDIFKTRFNKTRPDFLRNTVTGGLHNLELDCYSDKLRLAVEYNGIQHYKYVPFFHKNKEAFLNQKYRDYMKRQLCKENRITLIEVPYDVKISDIRSYIINQLKIKGFLTY